MSHSKPRDFDGPPRQDPGRRSRPLGLPGPYGLRAPPGLKKGARWPLPVADANYAVNNGRNYRRSARAIFTLAGALVVRAIEEGSIEDASEGFALFMFLADPENGSNYSFERYRPVSLFNAAVALDVMPHQGTFQCAADLVQRAAASLIQPEVEIVRDVLLEAVARIEGRILAMAQPVTLRWNLDRKRHRLIPTCERSKRRITTMIGSVVGHWPGVKTHLMGFGLEVPTACPHPAQVRVYPATENMRALVVKAM